MELYVAVLGQEATEMLASSSFGEAMINGMLSTICRSPLLCIFELAEKLTKADSKIRIVPVDLAW